MTNEARLALLRNRINKIEQSGESVKAPGVLRHLKREERKLENKVNE